ncbi:MAG: lipopolysaccharide transport system permease protein [Bacteroidia bacterium]|jgi:lipopolysaccharide transport system permease protein
MPLSQYWRLIDVMARMSLRADASKYYLGYIWWVLEPLLYVGVFYVVFYVVLDNRQEDFLIFLMVGKLTFLWFSKTVQNSGNSIVGGKGLVGKINLPKTLFPMAVVQESLYKQTLVFALLFVVLMFNGYRVSWLWLYLVPIIFVNYIMIVSCSFVASTVVCIIRDFNPLIGLGMIFLMFTSGIFWDLRALNDPELTELLLNVNPMAFLLDAYRQVVMYGARPDMPHLATVGAVFGALLCAMVLVMRNRSQYLALKALTS